VDKAPRPPEIYAEAAQLFPDHVRAIVVRQLTFGEHVLAHGLPVQDPAGARAERAAVREGIPVVQGADGKAILREIQARGLLRP
jgi:phosphatidate phosphatase APP1